MTVFAQKLKKVREESALSQKAFAEKLGIGPVSMNRLEKGNQSPDVHVLVGLRTLFGVDLNWLLNDNAAPESAIKPSIPVYDASQLNLPEDQRQRSTVLDIPAVEGDYAYRVKDEAMLPQVRQGDFVVVQQHQPVLGDLLLCLTETGLVQVRRLSRVNNQMVLAADNPIYDQIVPAENRTVLGKILRVVRTFEV
ncbi:SOS-response transcriptional repressor LexA (RecA-mediated autopeptidase) [Desulfuromusa kysingii]|uniref:SOS-response transcriptional repressor LexA (RecA-mediated autopeptidase) n=1 Tax=Desulfuromusa kysingii TaxID=37625 RepID=A0A1H4AEP1_9BACT|nr:XRE family transcriptional regulator [Desulfuromusa kysingii]SEA34455.1 SOS-response transcriptional repressor LexA (RecA-mediated autopeptidase) [Desulfuromusa kysingii]